MHYYVQGFDEGKEAIAGSGDAQHPYSVAIKAQISGPQPSLPGASPPRRCSGKGDDCPPDFPGCGKGQAGEGKDKEAEPEKTAEGEDTAHGEGSESSAKPRRIWLGFAGSIEFLHLPGGNNLCRLDPNSSSLAPLNSANYYCTSTDGSDFPSRVRSVPSGSNVVLNDYEVPGKAGNLGDSYPLGDVRVLFALDVALSNNFLIGVRAGAVFRAYPGGQPAASPDQTTNAAVKDGRASPLGLLHLEGRLTYVFGNEALAHAGLHPMVFAAGGVSEFDAYGSDVATVMYPSGATSSGTVNIWRTDGPGFAALGLGLRWALSERLAATLAARGNLAIGGNGLLPTVGPELGVQYGL
jgi:hypothetical protein